MRRVFVVALIAVVMLTTDALALRRPERHVTTKVNIARVNHDEHRLEVGWRISRYAERQARKMCRQHRLFHGTYGWPSHTSWGQVVGYGPSTRAVFRKFMRSAEHRAIILGLSFTRMGVGVAKADGIMWVAVDFAD
jgi:uncharacterized protein YkwD